MKKEYHKKEHKHLYILIGFIAVDISLMILIALLLGKDNIALDIIKAVVLVISGGLGGYGLGNKKK